MNQAAVEQQGGQGPIIHQDGTFRHVQFARPAMALGVSASFLGMRRPFAAQATQEFVGTLMGQIERRHYCVTFDESGIVGFLGWGLCERGIAEDWANGRKAPTYDQCLAGDTVVLFSVAASKPEVLKAHRRELKRRYPGSGSSTT
jgi:hypothetical protein